MAHFLGVPALDKTKSLLRHALDTTCKTRDHIESLADLRKEMANDIEVNALLFVFEQHQKDACNWVSVYSVMRTPNGRTYAAGI